MSPKLKIALLVISGLAVTSLGMPVACAGISRGQTNATHGLTAAIRLADFLSPSLGWIVVSGPAKSGWAALFHTKDGGKTWRRQVEFRDVGLAAETQGTWLHFLDRRHGFLATTAEAIGTGILTPILYRTSDGGVSWTKNALPEAPTAPQPDTTAVDFVNPRDGWMVSSLGSAATGDQHAPQIDRTTDGGVSWTTVARSTFGFESSYGGLSTSGYLTTLAFASNRYGWALGTTMTQVFYGYVTHSGGRHWQRGTLGHVRPDCLRKRGLYVAVGPGTPTVLGSRIFLPLENTTLPCSPWPPAANFMLQVTQGQSRWSHLTHLPQMSQFVDSIDSPTVWSFASGNQLIETRNAGRTWTHRAIPLPSGSQVASLQTFVSGRGYALVAKTKTLVPFLLETTENGGKNWKTLTLPATLGDRTTG